MPNVNFSSISRSARRPAAIAFLAAVLSFSLIGCGEDKADAPAALPKVVAVEVQTAKVPLSYTFNGVLTAKETVEIRARVSGYLAQRLFEEGSLVQAGTVLYKLDDRDLKAALDTAKANTAKAKASWENEKTTKDRMVALADKGAVSLQMRDNAVAKADEAWAAYQAAQADEEKAAVNLGYATITASTTGYINRSNVEVGSYVDTGGATLMTTIYNIDPIRAEFAVTDEEYARFKKALANWSGQKPTLIFHLTLGDERIPYDQVGTLEMTDPVIDPKTNTLGVRVDFPNPDHRLRPGMYANVIAITGEREVLVVPEEAVLDQANSKSVYVVNEQNTLVAAPVTVGELIDQDLVVTEGLKAGQKVVVEGLVTARPGLKVNVTMRPPAPVSGTAEGYSTVTEAAPQEAPAPVTDPASAAPAAESTPAANPAPAAD